MCNVKGDEDMKEIKTSDLGLATFLAIKSCELIDVKNEIGQYKFLFLDPQQRHTLLNDYFNRADNENSLVPALEFNDKLRSLKTYCYTRFKMIGDTNVKNAITKIAGEKQIDEGDIKEIIDLSYKYREI